KEAAPAFSAEAAFLHFKVFSGSPSLHGLITLKFSSLRVYYMCKINLTLMSLGYKFIHGMF
ncbi:hypothetical protein, partial [Pyramidobacter piscolens]|uniref:hypothetical protein n=1 Tax=Pyramidobacter piscolens TaxID=638849 RepID=UPI001E447DE8